MPNDLEKFSQGATILQQVDVSDIFTSLALGIAEAQEKLDDNSIKQAKKLAETTYGDTNTSLLKLGFVPTFYAFTHADISASLNLKMALKESFDLEVKLSIDIAREKNYQQEELEFIEKNAYKNKTKTYKGSKEVVCKASEKNSITIENESYSLDHSKGAVSMVEKFKNDVNTNTSVDEVQHEVTSGKIEKNESYGFDVWKEQGYLVVQEAIHHGLVAASSVGILQINNYPNTAEAVNIKNATTVPGTTAKTFDLVTGLTTSLADAQAKNDGTVYGLSKDGKLYINTPSSIKDSTLYFLHDNQKDIADKRRGAEVIYDTDLEESTSPKRNLKLEHKIIHQALRFLHQNHKDVKITITGYTDTTGSDKYNEALGFRRAEAVKQHIFGDDAANIEIVSKGEADSGPNSVIKVENRKVTITLDADYLLFIGGEIKNGEAEVPSGSLNEFVFLNSYNANSLNFQYAGESYAKDGDYTAIKTYLNSKTNKFYFEEKESKSYLLDQEATFKFYLFSETKSELTDNLDKSTEREKTKTKDTFVTKDSGKSSKSSSSKDKDTQGTNTTAMSASIDLRMSKQFEMSMEGNSSMSARLVAVPPPSAFLDEIKPE